jgi:D-alanine transaminase
VTTNSPSHGWPTRAPAGRIAYVNGQYVPHGQAGVHIEDRGLQFADAIYEVCAVMGGRLFDEEEHLDRLERSLRELDMAMPMARAPLKLVLREIARRNRIEDGIVYLQITRGALRRDHAIPANPPKPTLILTARNIDMAAIGRRARDGVGVVTMPDERWARCDIKSTALLANILAKTVARHAGAYEAWLIDRDGSVTEGSSTTAWIVDGEGRIVTRDLSHAILPGVTRRVLLEAAAASQMTIVERRFTPAEALAAREAFLTAATAGVTPIVTIDGKPVGDGKPGPVTKRLQELYRRAAALKAQAAN